jgi:hypothetical protein
MLIMSNQSPKNSWFDFIILFGSFVAKSQPPIVRSMIHEALNWYRGLYFKSIAEKDHRTSDDLRDMFKRIEGTGPGAEPGGPAPDLPIGNQLRYDKDKV